MKHFWPHRTRVEGFSIKDLAHKYRLKISRTSAVEISNHLPDDNNLISMKEEGKKISNEDITIKKIHWANRDFSEYKKAA